MFSVLKTFSELLSSARKGRQELRKSVFSHFADSCTIVARACGPDEPGGDPRGPGGEAQWPGGGYTAWTERATKSPAWEKG